MEVSFSIRKLRLVVKERIKYWMVRECSARGEMRNVHKILVGMPDGKRPLGRPRRRWEDMDLRETGLEGEDWIRLAQDRHRWQALVNAVMNLRFP
jgi:hypothetical protein